METIDKQLIIKSNTVLPAGIIADPYENSGDNLTKFPNSILNLLVSLIEIRKRSMEGESIEVPAITLITKNVRLKGFLIILIEKSHVVFHVEMSQDYAFVNMNEITGIIIHNYFQVQHLIEGINTDSAHFKNRPTSRKGSDLRKVLLNESKRLSDKFGNGCEIVIDVTEDQHNVPFIRIFIIDLVSCLISASNRSDISNLISSVETVTIRKGENFSITKKDKSLIVTDSLTQSYSTNQQRNFLINLILCSIPI